MCRRTHSSTNVRATWSMTVTLTACCAISSGIFSAVLAAAVLSISLSAIAVRLFPKAV